MNFVLIALCLSSGWMLRASRILPNDAQKGINTWILYIALPSVALFYVPSIPWTVDLVLPVIMPVVVWCGAWMTFRIFAKYLALDTSTHAALLLTAGLGNTSFVGFPLTQAYFGDEGLRLAVICDQLTFITLSTLGVITAINASHRGAAGRSAIMKNVLTFPPFVAFIAALILPRFFDISILNPLLEKLAGTLVPLALFSVGMQIRFSNTKGEMKFLSAGLLYKLLIAPVVILIIAIAFAARGIVAQVTVFESAMAPMITSAILATEYNLNPRLANLMVSVGIVLSIATTAAWWLVVDFIL